MADLVRADQPAAALTHGLAAPTRAEVDEIVAAQQFGVSFLPMMVMERVKLVE
jgi:hypothetical protein